MNLRVQVSAEPTCGGEANEVVAQSAGPGDVPNDAVITITYAQPQDTLCTASPDASATISPSPDDTGDTDDTGDSAN